MDSNNHCKKSNCNKYIIPLCLLILILFLSIIYLIYFKKTTEYKINFNFLKYPAYFILIFFLIIAIVIIIILATTKKSCDIKKNIANTLSFGLKNCIDDRDCNIHQKCSWLKCTDKKIENDDCDNNDDCVNNLWCNKNKCVPKRRIGEICCNDSMCLSQKCGDENKCVNSVNNIGDINDSCRTSDDCMFNLWCDKNKCNKKKNDGDKCNNDEVCISGKCSSDLYCLSRNEDKYYIPKNRGPCNNDKECMPGLVCDESVCKRPDNLEKKRNCKK